MNIIIIMTTRNWSSSSWIATVIVQLLRSLYEVWGIITNTMTSIGGSSSSQIVIVCCYCYCIKNGIVWLHMCIIVEQKKDD